MASVFLSDSELYFSVYVTKSTVSIVGEEAHHIMKVMRHSVGDEIYVTNGNGNIFRARILSTQKNEVKGEIKEIYRYENKLEKFTICLPRLRVSDRFEFALEKCVELGFTNFVVFESERTVAKGDKSARWKKIGLAAMKQSLRSYLPKITYVKKFTELNQLTGEKVIFDQNSDKPLSNNLNDFKPTEKYFLIFGPEGGLTKEELNLFEKPEFYSLTDNRLRAETAVVTGAALISMK